MIQAFKNTDFVRPEKCYLIFSTAPQKSYKKSNNNVEDMLKYIITFITGAVKVFSKMLSNDFYSVLMVL